ncbi:CASP8 and FADD-like apoptosis regulator [Hyperolius riggenbachi]|uniref:CASP8 and FADD-like apoptosis regulator n=1 Tax=Hyperolius riggenbachi TaxID=752182 RepID=UPI0035A3861C
MPPNDVFVKEKTHFLVTADTLTQRAVVMSFQCISSRTLLQIEEELESDERDVIRFACRNITSQTNIKELLSELSEIFVHGVPVVEVLCLVKRFDLLKRHLKLTRPEAERLMSQGTAISDYSKLLVEINEHMEEDDLESLVFLLKADLNNGGRLKKKTFLCLATDLEKNGLIAPENLDLLERNLQRIHRTDLKNKILKFKQKGNTVQGGQYINAAHPAGPRSHVPSSVSSSSILNGHKGSTPVQETRPFIQTEVMDDRYPVRHEPMGFCLIIDCVGNDAEMLERAFRCLHFSVQCHTHKSVQEVKEILRDVANMEQHRHHDMFVCIIISRGQTESLFFLDGCTPGLSLQNITHFFTGQSCPNLIGKPKLFFVQNYLSCDYEVEQDENLLETDGPICSEGGEERRRSSVTTPNEADIFSSHCKVNELELQRFSGSPSLYLDTLIELLSDIKRRKHQDIQEIHTELNRIIYNKQRGYSLMLQHTLTKKLFLHPA